MFVTATDEKSVVADQIGLELGNLEVHQPGMRVFDAGMGDGSLLAQLMRHMHQALPFIPWLVVAKEISIEDVRQALARLPDRFLEHPEMVFVVTNHHFRDAPCLPSPEGTVWREIALEGSTTNAFTEQIEGLYGQLAIDWQVQTSSVTGNPLYVNPAVLVLYRSDRRFLLEGLIPAPGRQDRLEYDLMIASQAYRARTPIEVKVRNVLVPLARSLAPGGRLVGVHARGDDPGLEIIRSVWPGEDPFPHRRQAILAEAARQLSDNDLSFPELSDAESVFRFRLHTMPSEEAEHIGTSSIVAAWNAATYVAQIDEARLEEATSSGVYLEATRRVMQAHGGVWWNNERYLIART